MGNIKISNRLKSVADMVTRGNRVADIGCDHAHTSIYLIQNNISNRIIAMDINEGPLDRAKENIELWRCKDYIELRLSDGAEKLKINEVDTILIAGMGGRLMQRILLDRVDAVRACDELVLQPQSEIHLVRKFISDAGFRIVKEDMIADGDKFYVIIKAKNEYDRYAGETSSNKEVYDRFGKYLLENKNQILFSFLKHEYSKCLRVISSLKKEHEKTGVDYSNRITELQEKALYMRKGLDFYEV